jgi:hypothetical protein
MMGWQREDDAAAVIRSDGADTRPRKERRGDRVLRRALVSEDERGKKKGAQRQRASIIGDAARRGASTTVGRHDRR